MVFLSLAEGIAAYKSPGMYVAHPWIFSNICHCNFIYKGTISIAMLELPNKNMDSFGVFCVMPCLSCTCAVGCYLYIALILNFIW